MAVKNRDKDRYTREELRNIIDRVHTVEDLKKMLILMGKSSKFLNSIRKAELVELAVELYKDKKNLEDILKALPPDISELILRLIWDGPCAIRVANEIYNLDLKNNYNYYNPDKRLQAEFWLNSNYEDIFIREELRHLLRYRLDPPIVKAALLDETPRTICFVSEDEEGELYENLEVLLHRLQDIGYFKKKTASSPTVKQLKSAVEAVSLNPFILDKAVHSAERLILIIPFISYAFGKTELETPEIPETLPDAQSLLARGMKRFFHSDDTRLDLFLLPHLRFSNKGEILEYQGQFRQRNLPAYEQMFQHWPFGDKWVDFNSVQKIFGHASLARPMVFFGADLKAAIEEISDFGDSYKYQHRISSESKFAEYVLAPHWNAMFFLWGALGLFELCWDPIYDDEEYRLKGEERFPGYINHVRMTAAGERLFDPKAMSYEAEEKKNEEALELNEEHLMIRVQGKNRGARSFIESHATALGEDNYILNSGMIRKKCRFKDDLENFFKSLERYHGRSLPENWLDLKEELLGCYIRLDMETNWVVYILREEHGAVRNYLKQYPNPLFSFMNNERIIVHKENIRKFMNYLGKGGFTLLAGTLQ